MAQVKIQYEKNQDDVIRLFQYIFSNENNGRYALFNFHNQYKESVSDFTFLVSQLDSNGGLISKSKMKYNNFIAKADTFFVPKIKLELDDKCEELEVSLVEAYFVESSFIDGKLIAKPEQIVEEEFEANNLHYFHNHKVLRLGNPSFYMFITLVFITLSILGSLLYLSGNIG